ncbi:MAG: amidohydrolase family protein [Propionibacteriaceae bacterium]|nr:amidohydrolase family protein [Propionibacteriaceae bacterium]
MIIQAEGLCLGKELKPGFVETADGKITRVENGKFHGTPDASVEYLAPGFVDVHSHGGGGAAFTGGTDDARTVLATHRAHGTTTMIGSLVTATMDELLEQIVALEPLVHSGELAGIHLEGPWISPCNKGAHDATKLAVPDKESIDTILALEPGLVKMVTIAPELEGALEAIRRFASAGIVAALGHTVADFDMAVRGLQAGARGFTHLFNAMPDLKHRDPGPVLAGLRDAEAYLELIFDTHHVDRHLVSWVIGAEPERVVLITDAMEAAGMPDGNYSLGGLPVKVVDTVARLVDGGSIAGSTIFLETAVMNAVANDISLAHAVWMATTNPASYLGLQGVGKLEAGFKADLIELDATGKVQQMF